MNRVTLYLISLLFAGCMVIGDDMPIIEPLPYGQSEALYAGCVRGIVRWQHDLTGVYPQLDAVHRHCEAMRRSFKSHERRSLDSDI